MHSECRAPLLWWVVPVIAGYLIARHQGPTSPQILVFVGVLLAGVAWFAVTYVGHRRARAVLWAVALSGAVVCLSWSGFMLRWQKPAGMWRELPPREAELVVAVEEPFGVSAQAYSLSGIARVVAAPRHLQDLVGLSLLLTVRRFPEGSVLIRSARLRVRGVLSYVAEGTDGSSFHTYLNQRGIFLQLRRGHAVATVREAHAWYRFCAKQNQRLEGLLRKGGRDYAKEQNVMVAMLLGNKAALSREQRTAFQSTGTLHFFAISGLHIGVIAGFLFYLLGWLRVPFRLAGVLGLVVLLWYVYITGARPSALRALNMVGIFWGAFLFLRKPSAFSALVASALGVLLVKPQALWNPGFQLSYLVVAAILLYGLPLAALLRKRWQLFTGLPADDWAWHHRLRQKLLDGAGGLLAISLAVTLMSSPLSVVYFNVFAPGGVLLNLLLMPLVSLAIVVGFSGLFLGVIGLSGLTLAFNFICWGLVGLIERILAVFQVVPGFFTQRAFYLPWLVWPTVFTLLLIFLLGQSRSSIRNPVVYCIAPVFLVLVMLMGTESLVQN